MGSVGTENRNYIVVTSTLALLLVSFIALYLVLQRKKFPPGPLAFLPVVGSFPALSGKLPHRTLQNLASKYGGLMFLRLGTVPTIVVSTAAIAKELFQNHDGNFLDRPKAIAFDILTDNGKNLVHANGLYWRQLRKICTSELFSVKRQASYQGIRTEEIHTSMKEIVASSDEGTSINIKSWLNGVTSNNMTTMLINKRYFGAGSEEKKDLMQMLSIVFEALGAFIISDFVPCLGFVTKLQGLKKRLRDLKIFYTDNVIKKVFEIERRRECVKERVDDGSFVPNLVDVLLQTPLKDGEFLPDLNINLVLGDMLSAGTETIATAAEWAIAELMLKPELIQLLQKELDIVVGSQRLVQESDLPNLTFLQAVVKETFRLHPPLALSLPRESTQAFAFRGYNFPKQTRLILNLFSIHRDPNVYDLPDEFRPDRFVDRLELNHLSGFDSYELSPFSVGRRLCPAANLGNVMLMSMLAHLLHSFDWSFPEGESAQSLDMAEQFGLTVRLKCPLRLIATPRPPASLY